MIVVIEVETEKRPAVDKWIRVIVVIVVIVVIAIVAGTGMAVPTLMTTIPAVSLAAVPAVDFLNQIAANRSH
jgi:hypothetical protein